MNFLRLWLHSQATFNILYLQSMLYISRYCFGSLTFFFLLLNIFLYSLLMGCRCALRHSVATTWWRRIPTISKIWNSFGWFFSSSYNINQCSICYVAYVWMVVLEDEFRCSLHVISRRPYNGFTRTFLFGWEYLFEFCRYTWSFFFVIYLNE